MSIFTDFDASYGDGMDPCNIDENASIDVVDDVLSDDNADHPYGTDFEDDDFVIRTPKMVGGHDTFVNGSEVTHTQANIFGGEDVYHDDMDLSQQTIPNGMGGEDIYDDDMGFEGSTFSDGNGGEDYLSFDGNADNIMQYDDPLSQVENLQMDSFNIENA